MSAWRTKGASRSASVYSAMTCRSEPSSERSDLTVRTQRMAASPRFTMASRRMGLMSIEMGLQQGPLQTVEPTEGTGKNRDLFSLALLQKREAKAGFERGGP